MGPDTFIDECKQSPDVHDTAQDPGMNTAMKNPHRDPSMNVEIRNFLDIAFEEDDQDGDGRDEVMDDSFREVDGAGTEDNGAQPTDELIAENPAMDAATKNLMQRAVETEITLDHDNVARGRVQNTGLDPFIGEHKQC